MHRQVSNTLSTLLRRHWPALVVLGGGAVAYTLLSIVNHLMFRTYGLDLGLYTHALYDYSHLHISDCLFFEETPRNFLSDHFDLYLPLLSPLVWVMGQYTLLVVQVAAVLFGAAGVYRFVEGATGNRWLGTAAMLSLLVWFGVWQALAFDYHSNVVAAMWVPWLFHWLRRERYGLFALAVVMVCIGKENMALWLFFILLALVWDYRSNRRALAWLCGGMAFCTAYAALVTMVVMPSLAPEKVHFMGKFKYMGDSFGAVAVWILTHPIQTLGNLFSNFLDLRPGDGLKTEFYICFLLSGGLLCLLKPNWLVMVIPLVAQKMLSDDIAPWGIANQYNVEFAPVVVCGVFAAAARMGSVPKRAAVAVAMPLLCLGVTIYTCSDPITWVTRENVRLFDARHYRQDGFDRHYANNLLNRIPADASVCASQCFTPHIALRDSVYLYPVGLRHTPQYLLLTSQDITPDTAGYRLVETDGTVFLLKSQPAAPQMLQGPNTAPSSSYIP